VSSGQARTSAHRLRMALGVLGVAVAAPFFAWFALGLVDVVPSMVDVFGVAELRVPASITVGGLLAAAVGFHEP